MSDPEEPQQPAPDQADDAGLDDNDFGFDWTDDESERGIPQREHVLAALRPTDEPYTPPVAGLLELGSAHDQDARGRREALGIGQEHVGELVRMARDRALYSGSDDDESPRFWAPIHAVELLEDLDVSAVIDELIPLLDVENDWFSSSLPRALGRAGEAALAPLRAYLADKGRWIYGHAEAISGLTEVAKAHPELREQAVAALSEVLADLEGYDETELTAAMSGLVELKAVEALPLIRRAFELDKIDSFWRGDWVDVIKELGVEPDPDDPLIVAAQLRAAARQQRRASDGDAGEYTPGFVGGAPGGPGRKKGQARKVKNKRKAAAASRKANKKKKRK